MVTWAGDGTMAGYDPVTKRLKKGLFHFASPGAVDLQGTTRLNNNMGPGLSATTYPNNLQATAPLTFTGSDFTANPGKKLGVGMLIVRASRFPEGHIPTPAEMWALPQTSIDWGQRSPTYANSPVTHTFELAGPTGFFWNTKWWVLLYPAAHTNPNITWSKTNDIPIKGSNINSVGRMLSFWSNRTPGKPTITSPPTGSVILPGAEFTLRMNPADLDEMVPEDAEKYNDDVNGVHFQCRPAPSADNANPEWTDLPFDWQWFYDSSEWIRRRNGAWNIRGSRNWNGLASTPEHKALVADLGCTVVAGAGDRPVDLQPGKGALSTGDWQIRGRTFDYGHPYPNSGVNTNEPGPLGINLATNWLLEPAKDTYPEQNRSPWSDPVTINIPAQVPPPLAVSPKDSAAVAGNPGPATDLLSDLPDYASFEGGVPAGWHANSAFGSFDTNQTFSQSSIRASDGTKSLMIDLGTSILGEWSGFRTDNDGVPPLIPGRSYTVTAWVYVPTGSPDVRLDNLFVATTPWSSVKDTWHPLSVTFTHSVEWAPVLGIVTEPSVAGQQIWVDDISFIDNTSVTPTVRLTWNYRNTHQPPRAQLVRTVQIRKVGDLDWSTVFSGLSSESFVDLPWLLDQDSIPPLSLFDGTFEGGTTEGWDGGVTDVVQNVNDVTKAHSGSRYLKVGTSAAAPALDAMGALAYKTLIPPDGYLKYTLDGWVWIPPDQQGFMFLQMTWVDADGLNLLPDIDPVTETYDWNWPYWSTLFSLPAEPGFPDPGGWIRLSDLVPIRSDLDRLEVVRPPTGATMTIAFSTSTNINNTKVGDWRVDDLTLTAEGTGLDSFHIEVGYQYEWRVQATDTDNITSGFSTPARFWTVPAGASGEVRPVPGETIDGATLGCGTHRVMVYRRGGKERVGELTGLAHVDWSRIRDDISTAEVVVAGWDLDCGNLLSRLQTWAYELVIYRDNGYSVDRVWEGPITLLSYEQDKVTIDAKDVMGYAYRRIIKQKMTDSGTGNGTTVVDRARRILQNVFAPEDPNLLSYLQILARDDDAMQYRSTPAYSRTAFEEVDDMAANAGLDYTTVGRSIMLWGTRNRIGTLPELRDVDLGASPIVSEYGMSMANVYSVSDGNGVHGEATRLVSGNDPNYGLVEMLSSTWASDSEDDTGTYTQAGLETVIKSFEGYAERSIADRYPPPVVVRVPDNTTLNPDTVISIQHLVPGVAIPLRSIGTLRAVKATQKLDSVKVVEEAGSETVSITLSPFSRDDAGSIEGAEE